MDARLQTRIQRYGWDRAADDYEPMWNAQLAGVQAALLAAAALQPGEAVLDVACGPGRVALQAARAVGPQGSVFGIDLSERMVDAARERARQQAPGTLDFALMYLPSESVYYEIAVRDRGSELLDYAREQRVVICSPNTLYAYLQAIMMGVKGVQIAESAREIQETLVHLRQDFVEARSRFDRASDQLRFAAQNVDSARQALRRIERDRR